MNGFTLKIIAIVAMIIDHVGAIFFPEVYWLRIIGRLSMPIFAFLCAEGYHHTSDKKKYITRLLIFAFISEIPYDLMRFNTVFSLDSQNILFSFLLGVLSLYLVDKSKSSFAANAYPMIFAIIALLISSDYYILAVLAVVCFYKGRYESSSPKISTAIACLLSSGFFFFGLQTFAVFAIIPILLYNGKQGFKDKYYLFYWVYPLQFLAIYFIGKLI